MMATPYVTDQFAGIAPGSSLDLARSARLRGAGLDDLAVADVIHGAAFFNWANRLVLSLGEPHNPAA